MHMQQNKLFFILGLIIVVSSSFNRLGYSETPIEISGFSLMIDTSHRPVHTLFESFIANYTSAGNYVEENDTIENLKNYQALLIPGSRDPYSSDELETIRTWLYEKARVIFIGGDSDYGGFFNASKSINPLLNYIGSNVRLDAGAVADVENNDGMSYRVLATQPGNGSIGSVINTGLKQILLHGPTAIFGYVNDTAVDLRKTEIPNVEILFSYSNISVPLDQDASFTNEDFYFNIPEIGNYPAVIVEKIQDSYLVLAGEVLFTDYKNMFGSEGEHGSVLDNHEFVVRLLNYLLPKVELPKKGSAEPLFIAGGLLFATITILYRKRKR